MVNTSLAKLLLAMNKKKVCKRKKSPTHLFLYPKTLRGENQRTLLAVTNFFQLSLDVT